MPQVISLSCFLHHFLHRDHLHAGGFHLLDGAGAVVGLGIHSPLLDAPTTP